MQKKQAHPLRAQEALFAAPAKSLKVLAREVEECKNCDLWKNATQAVFGEGSATARVMLVGEQPGDQEDLQGRPFVGPAGQLLDKCLKVAGVDRKEVYVTNVVKHFSWEPRGKRRIHKKPNGVEIAACRPWLDAEIAAIKPHAIVCLGATAAQALIGRQFRVTESHGKFVDSPLAPYVMATLHPSAVLRAPDEKLRHEQEQQLITDLKRLHEIL
jgi:uracil-DNA glycosylase